MLGEARTGDGFCLSQGTTISYESRVEIIVAIEEPVPAWFERHRSRTLGEGIKAAA